MDDDFAALLEGSSLGSPAARRIRSSTGPEVIARVHQRVIDWPDQESPVENAVATALSETRRPETRTSLARARQELAHEIFPDTGSCSAADIWQDSRVAVWLGTPSAKKREFNFKVFFFTDTMYDPVELGRRLDDIAERLSAYLRCRHRFFEFLLPCTKQADEPQADVRDRTTADTTLDLPVLAGASVRLADLELITPVDLGDLLDAQNDPELSDIATANPRDPMYALWRNTATHGPTRGLERLIFDRHPEYTHHVYDLAISLDQECNVRQKLEPVGESPAEDRAERLQQAMRSHVDHLGRRRQESDDESRLHAAIAQKLRELARAGHLRRTLPLSEPIDTTKHITASADRRGREPREPSN
ncbi:hypothetical protein AB0L00_44785 [Actinoallomurus sp. NPDC052308]|uniref:hypothetical protein n=1 Tax=Actinoallomurus sp. NPDC052308 TaxID=3155530 RepID=UPI00342D9A21